MTCQIITGDCRVFADGRGPFDMVFADPPYGETALEWDRAVEGWLPVVSRTLKPSGSLWVSGSMGFFLRHSSEFASAGLRFVQDVVWEKSNGTNFAADRFRRVHELLLHFVRADVKWRDVYNEPQRSAYSGPDKSTSVKVAVRGQHLGNIRAQAYRDDGTRLVRSVIKIPSVRRGIHPTQKPVPLLETIVRTSCPPNGLVGDFFAGSGSMGEAATAAGRRYIGFEVDADMAARASGRLASLLPFGGAA